MAKKSLLIWSHTHSHSLLSSDWRKKKKGGIKERKREKKKKWKKEDEMEMEGKKDKRIFSLSKKEPVVKRGHFLSAASVIALNVCSILSNSVIYLKEQRSRFNLVDLRFESIVF